VKSQYDPIACVHAYIDYLKRLIAGSGELSLTDERTRLTKYQADIAQLQFQKSKGELISTNRAGQVWGEIVSSVRARLLGLPTKLAPVIAIGSSIPEIKECLETAIHEVLNELTEPNLETLARDESSTEGVEGFPAAAEIKGERVGRQEGPPKSGKQRRAGAVANVESRIPTGDDERMQ
jgi:hypothetical protein